MTTMKNTTLNIADRSIINQLCTLLMEMNDRNDKNASQSSTYGCISLAIIAFVLNQTDVSIGRHDWNLGGNHSYADDIQAVINQVVDSEL